MARASLEELRLDYEDFLRQRGLAIWERDDPRRKALVARRCRTADDVAAWVQGIHARNGPYGPSTESISSISSIPSISSIKPSYAGIAANAALVLIGVATALLDRQLEAQSKLFEKEGGFTERLYNQRHRKRKGE